MRGIKGAAACLLAAALTAALPISAMAANGTKITSISLRIESHITAGDSSSDVRVTSNSSRYDVDEVEVTNEPKDEWEGRDKPKLKVTLTAGDRYYFPSSGLTKSDVNLSGDDGKVTSVSRSGSYTFYVNITLDALDDENDYDLHVDGLEWDDSDGNAYWDDAEDAKRYEVRLYRGGNSVTSVVSTSDTSYDFSSHFTQSGYYYFRVRGVYNASNKGSWEESDERYVSSSEAADIRRNARNTSSSPTSSTSPSTSGGPGVYSGAWLRDDVGWWYCNADKSYTTNNWQYINNYWYFFDERGYMKTGWILWNGKWYYCCENGEMLHDTTTPDGYYVGSDGAWVQ